MQNAIVENNLIVHLMNYKTDNSIEVPENADLDDIFINGKLIKTNGIIFDFNELENLSIEKILEILKNKKFEKIKENLKIKVDEIIKNKMNELDYSNEGEISLYANNPKSVWHNEAVKLQEWIEKVYLKMYEILKSMDEKNYNSKKYNLEKLLPKLED